MVHDPNLGYDPSMWASFKQLVGGKAERPVLLFGLFCLIVGLWSIFR